MAFELRPHFLVAIRGWFGIAQGRSRYRFALSNVQTSRASYVCSSEWTRCKSSCIPWSRGHEKQRPGCCRWQNAWISTTLLAVLQYCNCWRRAVWLSSLTTHAQFPVSPKPYLTCRAFGSNVAHLATPLCQNLVDRTLHRQEGELQHPWLQTRADTIMIPDILVE